MNSNDQIAKMIADLRKQNKLSLNDLAKQTNISKSALSRYENNERTIPLEVIQPLAIALHTSPDNILGLSDYKYISSVYNKLSNQHKHSLLDYAEYLLHIEGV